MRLRVYKALFSQTFYISKTLLLFPIRVVLALFWFVWSLLIGGLDPGVAPAFHNNDQVCYYVKKKDGKFCLFKYNLETNNHEIIFRSDLPIEHLFFLNDNEIVCSASSNRRITFTIVEVNNRADNQLKYTMVPIVADGLYSYLPERIGLLTAYKVFCKENCFYNVVIKLEMEEVELEREIEGPIDSLTISNNEKYYAFSTRRGLFLVDILTKKQINYELQSISVHNWDDNNNLLVYSHFERRFFILNAATQSIKKIDLTMDMQTMRIGKAAISPKGNFIAYHAYRSSLRKKDCGVLVVQEISNDNGSTNVVSQYFKVFGIQWANSESYLSVAGVKNRDFLDIQYQYKMRNAATHDKMIIGIQGTDIVSNLEL